MTGSPLPDLAPLGRKSLGRALAGSCPSVVTLNRRFGHWPDRCCSPDHDCITDRSRTLIHREVGSDDNRLPVLGIRSHDHGPNSISGVDDYLLAAENRRSNLCRRGREGFEPPIWAVLLLAAQWANRRSATTDIGGNQLEVESESYGRGRGLTQRASPPIPPRRIAASRACVATNVGSHRAPRSLPRPGYQP